MGKCKYCNQHAGFLKSKHKACNAKYKNGKKDVVELIEKKIIDATDYPNLINDIKIISTNCFIDKSEINDLISLGFDNVVEKFLADGVLSKDEEERLNEFVKTYLKDETPETRKLIFDKKGSLQKINKATIIRDLAEGIVPDTKITTEQLPFIFQKSEKFIWAFYQVKYFEQITKTHYRGGSQGVSIKIAKGVYYRTNAFKGYPVQEQELKYLGSGIFAITDKHIYFSSPNKTFKTPYTKMITIQPYEDGIGIHKNGATAKPQVFKGIDGWFTYNIISNLTRN